MEFKSFLPFKIYKCFYYIGKCAAASLDVLSGIFNDEFLPELLPILKETLFSEKWEVLILILYFWYVHTAPFVI